MTRLLYWNLLSCGTNSLYPPLTGKRARAGDDDPDYGVPAAQTDARDRRTVFENVVAAVAPDIIVIVEVIPGPGGAAEGTTLADPTAFNMLLDLRRNVSDNYRLVPPIASGTGRRTEGIAVFYRADRLAFVGPFGWSGAIADRIANITGAGGALSRYAGVWGARRVHCLPPRDLNAFTGVAPWLPAHTREDTLAGQWRYTMGGAPVLFPAAGFRRPYRTTFVDVTAGNRLINLYACHVPPQTRNPVGATAAARRLAATANPRGAIAALAGIGAVSGAMGANEVRCIVGDFNISAWDAGSDPGSFQLLRQAGYRQQLNPLRLGPPNPPPAPLPATWPTLGYYATHLRGAQNSEPYVSRGGGGDVRGYPGFIYVTRKGNPGDWYDAIDNVFTRYTGADASANMTIVNPVTGSPYTVGAAPPNVLQGSLAVGSQMAANVLGAPPFAYPPGLDDHAHGANDARLTWREWRNYPKIRSLSDHMPLALDI